MLKSVLLIILLFLSFSAFGDNNEYYPFSFKCEFTKAVYNDWEKGKKFNIDIVNEKKVLYFSKINTKNSRAVITGNAGSDTVYYLITAKGISFIEVTPAGNTNYTTILLSYDSAKLPSVSSRHISFSGDNNLIASQRYGFCYKIDSRKVYDTDLKRLKRRMFCLSEIRKYYKSEYLTYEGILKIWFYKKLSYFDLLKKEDKSFLDKYKLFDKSIECFNEVSPFKFDKYSSPSEFEAEYKFHYQRDKKKLMILERRGGS